MHTITVNQPNMAPDALIVTEFGAVTNGGTITLNDEQVAVWQAQNPDRTLPTALDHSEAERNRKDALSSLRRPADEGESDESVKARHARADEIEVETERLRGLDLSDTGPKRGSFPSNTPPPTTTTTQTFMVPNKTEDGEG